MTEEKNPFMSEEEAADPMAIRHIMIIEDQKCYVAEGMETYGGGFVKALGAALRHADRDNTFRIKKAFPEYWDKYLEQGIELSKDQLN